MTSIFALISLLLAASSVHAMISGALPPACSCTPAGCNVNKDNGCSCTCMDGRRLLQASQVPFRFGSISVAAINDQTLRPFDAMYLYNAFDGLVVKVKVLALHNTVPSAALVVNLTRNLAANHNAISLYFSSFSNTSAYTVDDATGYVTLSPTMAKVASEALECLPHLTAFDFCPILKNNILVTKIGIVGYLDPLGKLNTTSAATIIRKATVKGLIGSTLSVQIGKPEAMQAYFNKASGPSSRKLMQGGPSSQEYAQIVLADSRRRS